MFTETQRPSAEAAHFSQMLAHEARLNQIHRLFKSHINVTEPSLVLDPYLFLGNCISAHDTHRLSKLGIRYVLNVAIRDVEVCPYYSSDVRTLTIDLRDDDQENILRTFDQAFAFIDAARRARSRVLVHCSHGQSRSPAIVIAYLMRTYNVSLEQCLTHVVKARPCIIPNDGFLKQLIFYDRFLVDRRRKQQEAAIMRDVNKVPPTEIPIQHNPPIPSQPVQPSSILAILVPLACPATPASDTAHVSSVDSSKMGLSSTSSVQSSPSTHSIHVIPIQVHPTEPSTDKIESIPIKKKTSKDATVVDVNKDINQLPEKLAAMNLSKESEKIQLVASASNSVLPFKNRSKTKKLNDVNKIPSKVSRSNTGNFDQSQVIHPNHSSFSSSTQLWDILNKYPTNHYVSNDYIKTNYITEIYDRATNRFIPTTCCY